MKKSILLTLCLGLVLVAAGPGYTAPIMWDVGVAGAGLDSTDFAGFDDDYVTGLFNQIGFDSQTSTIQYDDDGNAGFTVGDSFSDSGNLKVNGFIAPATIDEEGLNQLAFAGLGAYEATADWSNLVGTVSGISDAGDGDTQVDLDYDTGTINFYLDTNQNSVFSNPGGTLPPSGAGGANFADGTLIATLTVLDGVGHTFLDLDGGDIDNQGSVELLMQFTYMLEDFWLDLNGNDLLDNPVLWNFLTTDMNIDTPNQELGVPDGALWTAYSNQNGSAELTVVPEPSTMLLLGCGLIGLAFVSRKRSRG